MVTGPRAKTGQLDVDDLAGDGLVETRRSGDTTGFLRFGASTENRAESDRIGFAEREKLFSCEK